MRKQQIILLISAALLFILIFFIANKKPLSSIKGKSNLSTVQSDTAPPVDIIDLEESKLSKNQKIYVQELERQSKTEDLQKRINAFHQLSHFWKDSVNNAVLSFYYLGEKAKLENSEKSLNFAANSLLNFLMVEHDPSKQMWLATEAKELFEHSLKINSKNDSTIIGLGSTYMFGNISDNPMEGIMKVREVVQRDSGNVYAQKMLGLGGMKSGQYANAVKRFEKVLEKEPNNLLVIFSMAESYEQLADKENAIKWYTIAREKVGVENMKKDIDERIREIKLR